MRNLAAQCKNLLLFIDFFVVLGVELAALLVLSLFGGGPFAIWLDAGSNVLRLRKSLGNLPYDEVRVLLKKRMSAIPVERNNASEEGDASSFAGTETGRLLFLDNEKIAGRDLGLYAFTVSPQNRQGVWALLACLVFCALIYGGVDWGIRYVLAAALFLFGLCRLVRGIMEVV